MLIGCIAEGEHFVLVAVQGLEVDRTCWWPRMVYYVPALYRGYPFHVRRWSRGQVLCIDEASELISDSIGEPFFSAGGASIKAVLEILEFFNLI